MPGKNRKGPDGKGPMTGRKQGLCGQSLAKREEEQLKLQEEVEEKEETKENAKTLDSDDAIGDQNSNDKEVHQIDDVQLPGLAHRRRHAHGTGRGFGKGNGNRNSKGRGQGGGRGNGCRIGRGRQADSASYDQKDGE